MTRCPEFMRRAARRLAGAATLALMLVACGGPAEAPETRIRSLVSQVEAAAEAHDLSVFKDHIASGYQDNRGYNRQTVLRLVQAMLLRNQAIHLLTLVRSLEVDADTADTRVLVAMAGRPIKSAQALLDMRVDLMRFDVQLVREDGDWLVRTVDWDHAQASDFLSQ